MNLPKRIDFIAYVAEFTFECYFDKFMFVLQHGRDRAQIKQKLADAYHYFQKQQNEIPPPPPPTGQNIFGKFLDKKNFQKYSIKKKPVFG